MTDVVIWYLDWVVADQGRTEQPTGASSADQFILILAKTIYSQRLHFPSRIMNLRTGKMSNTRGYLGRWSSLLACLFSLYNVLLIAC